MNLAAESKAEARDMRRLWLNQLRTRYKTGYGSLTGEEGWRYSVKLRHQAVEAAPLGQSRSPL